MTRTTLGAFSLVVLLLSGTPEPVAADCPAQVLVVAVDATVARARGGPPTVDLPFTLPAPGAYWLELENGPGGAPAR